MAKLSYLHDFSLGIVKQICHRDLKLENTLLDGSTAPRLKICDFGYSKVLLEPSLLWLLVCCLIAVIFLIYIMQHDNWYDHSVLYCSGLLTVKKKDYLCFLYLIYCHAVFWTLFTVISSAFTTKIHCGNSSIHCSWSFHEQIQWQGILHSIPLVL